MALPSAAARLARSLPLDALRGFEAAARLASFTAAADELSLTQSAVSKQVKALEDTIGRPLFERGPRGLALTAEGRVLLDALQPLLRGFEAALAPLAGGGARRTVSISVTPSFGSLWLAPRLPELQRREPTVDLYIDASEATRALDRDGLQLAIRQARDDEAAAGWTPLLRERVMLVAAPALAAAVRCPADIAALPLLVFRHAVERHPWMSWPHWLARLGLPPSPTQPLVHFSQYEPLLKAAIEGAGLALGRTPLVAPALHDGRLQVVLPEFRLDGLRYHLVVAAQAAARPEVQRIADWFGDALAEHDAGRLAQTPRNPASAG
jgi:LysR family transcriptional regulator, glycine cleavage system transcriptional activator